MSMFFNLIFTAVLFLQVQAFSPCKPAILERHKPSTSLSVVDHISFLDISNVISDAADNIPFPTGDSDPSSPSPLRIAGSIFGGVVVWYLCGFGMEAPKPSKTIPPEGNTLSVVEAVEEGTADS